MFILIFQCVKALDWFVDNVKSDGERALPKDGTVHEVTSNAVIFLEQLLEFAPTLAPMLQRDSVAIATGTLEQAKALLGGYISKETEINVCSIVTSILLMTYILTICTRGTNIVLDSFSFLSFSML